MSVESLFTESDKAELQALEEQALRERFVHASEQEAADIAELADQIRPQVGPEKSFNAAQFAQDIYAASSAAVFETKKQENIFWAEWAEKMQRAWGEKLAPVAIITRTHELFDVSNPRSTVQTKFKLYTGVQTATFGVRQAYANWDQVFNDDDIPEGLQAIELPFQEVNLMLLTGYILDENNFAQTGDMPVEIPLSRIEKIFYLAPNHPGDPV